MLECPVVAIHIPAALRSYTDGHKEVIASGDTLGEVLDSLDHAHPGIMSRLVFADGHLSPDFDLYLGPRPVNRLQGLDTRVEQEELLSIIPARGM